MAGDWLKVEVSTPDKPEIWLIAEELKIDPDAVVGKLLRVWAWFDQQTENGNAPIVTKRLLDRKVGVIGFCNSIIKAGWMEEGNTLLLPNFDRHNGQTAKKRALTAKRVAKCKKTNADGNAKVTQTPLPKEEKRREENSTSLTTTSATLKSAVDFSILNMTDEQVKEVKRIRKANKGGSISQRTANGLAKEFNQARANGFSIEESLTEWDVRDWKSFKSEWMGNKYATYQQSNGQGQSAFDKDDTSWGDEFITTKS